VFKWFMPKEERFQELFAKNTANMVAAAKVFSAIAASTSLETRRVKRVELQGLEHAGDKITHRIFDALNSTFITPMDREDIRSLATDLDDVVDYIESVATMLILFELEASPEALRQFASILESMCSEVDHAISLIWDLANAKRIQESLIKVSELENQADQLYQTVIADLFKGKGNLGPKSGDALEVMKWKEIYDSLENGCDACKETTHVLGNILVKGV
jgi:predicted phosphate transport protein (TIGR00153 family)